MTLGLARSLRSDSGFCASLTNVRMGKTEPRTQSAENSANPVRRKRHFEIVPQPFPQSDGPYGASKLCGEAYCSAFAASYGIETVRLRFANVYGPYSAHKRGAITLFINALRSGDPIVIYGDGSASRDLLYVDDICDGICAGLTTSLPAGSVFHLASGVETTVRNLAQALKEIAGRPDHPVQYEPRRAGEVDRNFASFDLAQAKLGFAPKVELGKGLVRTWQWFLDQEPASLAMPTTDS